MKTVSILLIDKLKAIFYSFSPSGEFVYIQDEKPASLQKEEPVTETAAITKEKTDLVLLQRKAYCGNFFLGPFILFHPDLFD